MTESQVIFRDFTRKHRPVAFGIDGVRYECVVALGTDALQDLMRLYRGSKMKAALDANDADSIMQFLRDMFEIFLLEDAYERFVEKLRDKKAPVDIHQLLEIVAWIVEVYTARPLGPSSDSSNTSQSDDAGTFSTAGAPPEPSIP